MNPKAPFTNPFGTFHCGQSCAKCVSKPLSYRAGSEWRTSKEWQDLGQPRAVQTDGQRFSVLIWATTPRAQKRDRNIMRIENTGLKEWECWTCSEIWRLESVDQQRQSAQPTTNGSLDTVGPDADTLSSGRMEWSRSQSLTDSCGDSWGCRHDFGGRVATDFK